MERVTTILNIARSRSTPPSAAVTTQPEYLPLGEADADDMSFYTVDTAPGGRNVAATSNLVQECPDNLEEMLGIVRELRRERMEKLMLTRPYEPIVVTPAMEDRRAAKQSNQDNYLVTNLDDMYDAEL